MMYIIYFLTKWKLLYETNHLLFLSMLLKNPIRQEFVLTMILVIMLMNDVWRLTNDATKNVLLKIHLKL